MKLVFMGTPHFAKEFLEHLYLKRTFDIKGVYTQAPKKANRGQKISLSAVHRFAKEKNLNIYHPNSFSKSDIDNLKKINPDVIVVASYGLILPKEVLDIPCCGSVNVHASLLPKWRGAAPIQRSIMNGDTKTGISIMKIVEGLDEGPTYLQTEIRISQNDTYEDIYNNLIDIGKQTLDIYFSGKEPYAHILPIPQDHKLATYAKKISKSEMQIDFQDNALTAHKKICAFSPKPGAWFSLDSKKYKIFETEFITKDKLKDFKNSKKLILSFKKDYLLVKKIQKEGKNIVSIEDFERGNLNELENIKKNFSKH